jgi:tetratricopeptide (TPR) repeat protein
MSESRRESVESLLKEGIAAARAGDREEARRLLLRVTELDEQNAEAWLWLSSVTDTLADKLVYLEQAVELDPDNDEAQAALERVRQKQPGRAAVAADQPFHCTWHPDRETLLRCNRCGRPMCVECAVRHPVGMRCKECVRQTRSPIYDVRPESLAIALSVGTAISVVAAFIVPRFGFWGIFIAPVAGGIIAEAIERTVPRQRGLPMQAAAAVSVVLGLVAAQGIGLILQGGFVFLSFVLLTVAALVNPYNILYVVLAVSTAVARLR